MKNKKLKYTYNVIGFSVILFLALREICSAALTLLGVASGTVPALILGMLIFVMSCFVPVVCMENMLGLHPKLFNRRPVYPLLASGAYGYLCLICAGFVNSIFLATLRKVGLDFAPVTQSIPDGVFNGFLYFIHICILAPVLEEIFVRGYILNSLRRYGVSFAVVVSSAIFAFMHQGLENFLLYFVCGIILAEIYLIFDSIYASMLLHFINNAMSFAVLWFRTEATAINVLSLTVVINIFVLILGLWGRYYLNKNGYYFDSPDDSEDTLSKLTELKSCPVAVAALCLLIFFAALASFNRLV